ncbi:aspartate--tRNA ligase [Candidatus Peregrinibacteria bacterium HGW-Peregrinibacteria-1]|nr:MAG: aspartate--tRNA ligase [Candidatus Peregrinibacteria bacterium HGW-Peregrinibacteria-1]
MYRSHTCNDLRGAHEGSEVVLSGWVNRRRDHGSVIFIDLRDRYGVTQVVSDPDNYPDAHAKLDSVRSEYVIKVTGFVRKRPEGNSNDSMETGDIEVLVTAVDILNESLTPPFEIDQDKPVGEEVRLSHRYLDLRRERMKNNIILRHKIIKHLRDYFSDNGFLEIETPILVKGTPEGSREYLVPSRLHAGSFYVLPQSPQQLKQMLMVAGMDRYFQIARCFRDEDQRGDRQPEFTQLDIEMSFVDEVDVMKFNEEALIGLTEKFASDKKIMNKPFPVLSYHDAMNKYGSDKPDLRFGLELSDVGDIVKHSEFGVFTGALNAGGVVKAMRVPGGASFTRKDIDELTEVAKIYKAKGLAYIIMDQDGPRSPILKFLSDDVQKALLKHLEVEVGDIVFFSADRFEIACESLGQVRLEVARRLDLMDANLFAFCWVDKFPMFEQDPETGEVGAVHHPFTSPLSLEDLEKDPMKCLARAYDVVLNGSEIGGGSIRIHDSVMQKKIFDLLGITDEDAEKRFGHILKAFKYGAPPHGGIAWGLDRLVMLFAGEPNIREVIAFPKDQKAKDLMLGAPSQMPDSQVAELHIKVDVAE